MAGQGDLQVVTETEELAEGMVSRCSMILEVMAQITSEALDTVQQMAFEVEQLEGEEPG